MTTAAQQARYRARDNKKLIQVRLDPATVERLDRMVDRRSASGRAQVIEALLTGKGYADPIWLASDGLRLVRQYFDATGETGVHAGEITATRR